MPTLSTLPPSSPITGHDDSALRPLVRAVRARPLFVTVTVLAAVLGAVAFLALRTPTYDATANVLVNPLPQDDDTFLTVRLVRDSGDPTRTVQTAATLLESPQAAEMTAQSLGDGWTAEKVLNAVAVEPQGETNVLAVTATDDDARGAAELANRFTRSALEARRLDLEDQIAAAIERLPSQRANAPGAADTARRLSQLREVRQTGDPTLTLSQEATPPSSSEDVGAPLVVALALLAGLALGLGGALLLELFDRRLRDESEILATYDLPVLARVPLVRPRELQQTPGAGWRMPPPVAEAFRSLAVQLDLEHREHRSIMITSGSTGDGKTTSAVNLAVAMASAGKKVVLFDYDVRKPDIARTLGLRPKARPSVDASNDSGSLAKLMVPAPKVANLSVLAMTTIADDFSLLDKLHARLAQLLAEAREQADYVVIDTAPLGQVSDALRVAAQVDDIVVVARAGNTDRNELEALAELLERGGHPPKGYLLLETPQTRPRGYHYAYGAAQHRAPLDEPSPVAKTSQTTTGESGPRRATTT